MVVCALVGTREFPGVCRRSATGGMIGDAMALEHTCDVADIAQRANAQEQRVGFGEIAA